MMSKAVLFILSIFLISCQTTKLISKTSNGFKSEEYYIKRVQRKDVKHGKYESFYVINNNNSVSQYPKESGYYSNGKKDSLWVEYYRPKIRRQQIIGGGIETSGYYKNGEKVGVWTNNKRKVAERYDFDLKKELSPYVSVMVSYPQKAMENGIQGLVTVRYQTYANCNVSNIEIIKSLSPECDREVIRAIKELGELMIEHGSECKNDTIIKDMRFVLE